jgi:hypothetical protein
MIGVTIRLQQPGVQTVGEFPIKRVASIGRPAV